MLSREMAISTVDIQERSPRLPLPFHTDPVLIAHHDRALSQLRCCQGSSRVVYTKYGTSTHAQAVHCKETATSLVHTSHVVCDWMRQ